MMMPVVDQLPVGIFRKDRAGRFSYVNSRFCQLKAISAESMLGRTATEITADASLNAPGMWRPDDAAHECRQHALIMQNGESVQREGNGNDAGGSAVFWQVIESAVRDEHEDIIGTQGILLDLTRRKHADDLKISERELLRALLDNSPDHIYFKDTESRFIKTSTTQALDFGGSTPEWLEGKTDFDVFSDEHARPAFEDEQEIIRTGVAMVGKVEKETWMDGRPDSWALTTKMPLRNRAGTIIGTFGITKDISDLIEAERKITEVHKKLLEASRVAGMAEIATNVLHNVGNVLNSVNVSAALVLSDIRASKMAGLARAVQLMDERADDLGAFLTADAKGKLLPGYLRQLTPVLLAEQQRTIDELMVVAKNVEHIKEIIAAQQSYAGASSSLETLQAADLVDDALRFNAASLERRKVTVEKDIAPLPALPLDKGRILQILVNLISNAEQALQHTDERAPKLRITLAMVPGALLRIQVADNGTGIAPEHLTKVFAHGFTTRKTGHGFGLHSAVNAAHEMGGTLTVHSDGVGAGATFTLELPTETNKEQV